MKSKRLKLYTVTEEYICYLQKNDNKIMDNFGRKEKRPYLGVVFEINDKKYLAPLTSPKPKHKTMQDNLDFLKINEGESGAINLNNMFPVPEKEISIKNIEREKGSYKILLRKQITWCNITANREKIRNNAKKLYDVILLKKDTPFHLRCCNFKLLEEKALEWEQQNPTKPGQK